MVKKNMFFWAGLKIEIYFFCCTAKKSKRPSQNYGKVFIKTSDKNIWMQINFIAELYSGSLELYNEEQLKFHVTNNQKEVIQSVDLVNKYSFPIVVYGISLNEIANEIFEVKYI